MKIKTLIWIALAVVMSWGLAGDAGAAEKVGYINLSLVFDSYNDTKEADADLQQEAEAKSAEREQLVESIKRYRDELELLSPDNRADKQKQIDDAVQELQDFDRDSRMSLRRKRDSMIRDILQEIDQIVQKYGRDNGYDYIFNDRVLLFKKDDGDISQKIIDILNAGA